MKKNKKIVHTWIYSKPKEPLDSSFLLETDIAKLQQEIIAVHSDVFDVLYMLPNSLAAGFERHAVSQWKKFYKTVLLLKQGHPNRIRLFCYEDILAAGHADRQASFLGNAFSLKVMDPDLFELWSSIESLAQLGNRQPVDAKLLVELLSPGISSQLEDTQHQLKGDHDELSRQRTQLQQALVNLHKLQSMHEESLTKRVEPSPLVSPVLRDDKAVGLLIHRLHRLQRENEKLMEECSAANISVGKAEALPIDTVTIDYQRLEEKLILVQGELARQHAVAHAFKTELGAVQQVLEKARDFLTQLS